MKKNIRSSVLIGAQFWAYGPAGKANAIAHELKKLGVKIDFVGVKTSHQLCKASGHFNNLYNFNSGHHLDNFPDYKVVISVMDPYMALWAYKRKIPLIYVDSMSWFWRWNKTNSKLVKNVISQIDYINFINGCKILDKFEPDQRQLFAHLISDKILSQGNPQVLKKTKNKISNVGSIIDLNYIKKTKRDTLLISLSGGISPATNLTSALNYTKLVLDLLSDKLEKWPGTKRFIITGHPLVISSFKKYPKILKLMSLSHQDFLKELNRAVAVLLPCGFTTIYESLAYGTPVAFLPENHNGHVYEYLTITKGINNISDKEKIFPHALFCINDANLNKIKPIEESMSLIKNYTNQYFNSANSKNYYLHKVDWWLKSFKNARSIYENQRKQILTTIPDFCGADRVAKAVAQFIK